jgi:hypothetical protein
LTWRLGQTRANLDCFYPFRRLFSTHDSKKNPGRRCPAVDDGQDYDATVCN